MSLTDDRFITLAHGNGGRFMRELIEQVFARHLANPQLDIDADAAHLPLPPGEVLMTTDGFIVQPLEFPGGDIGSLAVHGTVNDLAVSGAIPVYLTPECLHRRRLRTRAARPRRRHRWRARHARPACGSSPATSKCYPAAKAAAFISPPPASASARQACGSASTDSRRRRRSGQRFGRRSRHGGAAGARAIRARGDLRSDSASVLPLTQALLGLPGLRFMRDPTRGGLATVAHEIAHARA